MKKHYDSVIGTNGAPIGGALVAVYAYGTTTPASIFSDSTGLAPITNPLATDGTGYFEFYAADGRYTLSISGIGLVAKTIADILLDDPSDASSGAFSTLTVVGSASIGDAETSDAHAIKGATTLLSNSTAAALTITQTGSGNALVVEDSSSPDSTPFAVASDGTVTTFSSVQSATYFHAANGTATAAGGTAGRGLFVGASVFGVYFGSGVPTVSGTKGSLYLRSDGSTTNNRMYINTDGGTTWTAVVTVI